MDIGTRIRKWRHDRGWSQRAAASAAGISQPAWQALESGRGKRIGLEVAARIVNLLGGTIALADLIEDDEVRQSLRRPRRSSTPRSAA